MRFPAGFDTHFGDLASLGLIEQDYFDIGKKVALLRKPAFFVLEGGYVGEKVGLDIDMFLRGYEENRSLEKGLFLFFRSLPSCLTLQVSP